MLQHKNVLVFCLLMLVALGGCAGHHQMHDMSDASADHSAHQAMMQQDHYTRKVEAYTVPDLLLTDNLGQTVSLEQLLETDKPVIVNFLYATCTTICPLLAVGYIDLQRTLGPDAEDVLLVSITIDPEHDTPEVLEEYRKKFQGRPGWTLLTGTRLDIDNVMNAFDAFFGDKMDHEPLNFIRLPEKGKWLRLNGMVNGEDFLREMNMSGVYVR